jgi:putative two-component system response regulator
MIFVVDDNDTNLTMAKLALKEDYRVLTMSSAERMFQVAEKVKPDLILLDVEMPDMNGYEAIGALKEGPLANVPVVFLTGNSDPASQTRGLELGAAGYIVKPFSRPALLECARMQLE